MSKSSVFQSVSTTESDLPDLLADIEAAEANAVASATSAAASAASVGAAASTATQEAANAASSATAAANSATAAANSETAAGNSETAAGNSATAASNSATTASGHANTANTAAGTASGHASDALSHKTDAETAETNALASQTAAAASATAAGNSETAAGNSETAAGNSQTAAGNSATAAANSATAAGNSETAAGNSETNAANSATAAGNSATAAGNSATAAANSATDASNHATTAQGHKNSALAAQTAAESARDSALSAYDNFDDRYLGVKTSNPSTDNDGDALVAGTLYFNSTDGSMKLYTGSSWVDSYVSGSSFAALSGATFTGDVTVNTDFTVDSGTLFVDSSSNRVGINLGSGNTPASNLHIKGGQRWEDTVNGNILDLQHYSAYSFLYRSNGALRLSGQGAASTNYLELNNSGGFTYAGNNIWHAGNLDSILDLGITDGTNGQALKTDGSGNLSFGDVATSTAWADVTGKPTTISGFGITDAFDGATTSLTGTNFSASSPFQFLNGGNAQGIRVNSLYAGTSYSADGSASGMVDTLNGYRVGGTQVIDSSRNLTNIGTINGYSIAENGGNKILKTASNGYIQIQDWINVGSAGLYSSTANGAHFRPNTATSYATWRTDGSRGGYDGILFDDGGQQSIMFDSSRNGGIYAQNGGRWVIYHHYGNNCLGVGHSSTSSSYELYVSGDIYATGNITAYSDARAKENVETIDGALGIVEQMRGVYYNKIDNPDKTREMGFLAQEVNAVEGASELVTYAEDIDQYSVSYGNTAALLVEAVKELSAEVKTLKAEIEELKNGSSD